MRNQFVTTFFACAMAMTLAHAASAQAPAGRGGAPAAPPYAIPAPTYVSIPMEVTVNRPAADVWKRVGKYCDIAEWLRIAAGCTITAGKDNEFGAVRSIAGEVLVGKTELSYTYTQQVRTDRPYNLYHGTLEARPVDRKSTRLNSSHIQKSRMPSSA